MRFLCRDCWQEHGDGSTADECVLESIRLRSTEEGRAVLAERKRDVYAQRADFRDSAGASGEEWHHASKLGCPAEALVSLRNNPASTAALEAARRFCREGKGLMTNLTLLGPTGVGKTVAACFVVVDFCRSWQWNSQPTGSNFQPCMYVRARELTHLSAFDSDATDWLNQMRSTRLLVLEDAGDEGTELGRGALVDLLMDRHAQKRRTVLCSNSLADAFTQRYGQAVVDRVKTGGPVPNLQNCKSMRRRAL